MYRVLYYLKYGIKWGSTFLMWKLRLGRLGYRSIIGRVCHVDNPHRLFIGNKVRILPGARIEVFLQKNQRIDTPIPLVLIQGNVNIGHNFFLTCASGVEIGEGTLISDTVAIIDNKHVHESIFESPNREGIKSEPIIIEKNVTIYRCSTILAGVTIGEGSIVGAHSLVNDDVPPFSIVAGTPAKVIRMRK
jgi:acetyltransferase-like isoleucine patch superfamily enzyme